MELKVISLRYSSWSWRAWLALKHAKVDFKCTTVPMGDLHHTVNPILSKEKSELRKSQGSDTGLFPVLHVGGKRIHEALAICKYVNDLYPQAQLWPSDPLQRALARSACSQMATGFTALRTQLSSHLFGRVDLSSALKPETVRDAERIFSIWRECISLTPRADGPFLFGKFSIADCFYYPVLARFRTYNVMVPDDLKSYESAVFNHPLVKELEALALSEPKIEHYDAYISELGGHPCKGEKIK